MNKLVFKMEFEKLWRMPVFYLLAVMFIGFNIWFFLDSKSYYIDAMQYDSDFMREEPEDFKASYQYDYYAETEMDEIEDMAKLYRDYGKIANGLIAENYNKLKQRAETMSDTEKNSLTYTGLYRLHEFLFVYYLKYIMIECIIIMILAVIYLMHFEVFHSTEELVMTSKTGEKVFKNKLIAAFLFSMLLSVVIMVASLGVYFGIMDYSGIWDAYISSNFNTERRVVNGMYLAVYPYITWIPATIKQYLSSCIAVILGILLFGFMAVGALSKRVKNSITVIAVIGIGVAVFYFIGNEIRFTSMMDFFVKFNPVHLITKCGYWFMDYAPGDTYPIYEILTLGVWLTGAGLILRKSLGRQ